MGAIRMVARTELRRHWRGTVAVMLLVGVVGAVTLAALAGARRSSSSLQRFNDVSRSSNIQVELGSYTPAQLAALRRILATKATNPVGSPIVPTEIDRLRKINWFPRQPRHCSRSLHWSRSRMRSRMRSRRAHGADGATSQY